MSAWTSRLVYTVMILYDTCVCVCPSCMMYRVPDKTPALQSSFQASSPRGAATIYVSISYNFLMRLNTEIQVRRCTRLLYHTYVLRSLLFVFVPLIVCSAYAVRASKYTLRVRSVDSLLEILISRRGANAWMFSYIRRKKNARSTNNVAIFIQVSLEVSCTYDIILV